MQWEQDRWPNFFEWEFRCKETSTCEMDPAFMDWLQALRTKCNFGFTINSGYRSPLHSAERNKAERGSHTYGVAVDIAVSGARAHLLVKEAMTAGVLGLGVKQLGPSRFIHLDMWKSPKRPMIWSY